MVARGHRQSSKFCAIFFCPRGGQAQAPSVRTRPNLGQKAGHAASKQCAVPARHECCGRHATVCLNGAKSVANCWRCSGCFRQKGVGLMAPSAARCRQTGVFGTHACGGRPLAAAGIWACFVMIETRDYSWRLVTRRRLMKNQISAGSATACLGVQAAAIGLRTAMWASLGRLAPGSLPGDSVFLLCFEKRHRLRAAFFFA